MSQIMIQDLGFTYEGDYTPVFEGLDLQLDTNWRLGLVGRNGRGKTTLLRLLEGELEGVGQIILPGRCRRYPKPVLHMDLPTRQVLLDGMAVNQGVFTPWTGGRSTGPAVSQSKRGRTDTSRSGRHFP